MNDNYRFIVREILFEIQKLTKRLSGISDLTWTKFRLITDKLDESLINIYMDLESGKDISERQINSIFDKDLNDYITQLENGNYSNDVNYEEELDNMIQNIEILFTSYLENSRGAYYVGINNYDYILNGFPDSISVFGNQAMADYREKYLWVNGCPRYSLENIPEFSFKEFIPDLMKKIQKSDTLNSLIIHYSNTLMPTLNYLLFNQSQHILNYLNEYFKNNLKGRYKTIYFALPDASLIEYNPEKNKISLVHDNGVSCEISSSRISYHKTDEFDGEIENMSLSSDYHKRKLYYDFTDYQALAQFLNNFEKIMSGLTINIGKTCRIDNMLEQASRNPIHK